ncbi:hypothetical protein CVT24_012549 [Panaeolus cyanescens]|uniref:VWFA domain-containing protein n=1 Tax=Panaeolus cyanescens TaxID=181874 RepID=A0A409WUR2_9AGAR|nr:hypothetical protein CVT24_012549 [Panaeolus cyanescens]
MWEFRQALAHYADILVSQPLFELSRVNVRTTNAPLDIVFGMVALIPRYKALENANGGFSNPPLTKFSPTFQFSTLTMFNFSKYLFKRKHARSISTESTLSVDDKSTTSSSKGSRRSLFSRDGKDDTKPSGSRFGNYQSGDKIDIVFLQDTTASQGPYIKSAKDAIEDICHKIRSSTNLSQENIRFGLVAFRDHPPQDRTYVTKQFGFTSDIQVMRDRLASLAPQGGGDGPEAQTAALAAALNMKWKEGAVKMVVLITDAPPHGLGESGDAFDASPDQNDPLQLARQMAEQGITLFVVACEPELSTYKHAVDFYKALTEITGGLMFPLTMAKSLGDYITGSAVETFETEKLIKEYEEEILDNVYAQSKPLEVVVEQVRSRCQSSGVKLNTMDVDNIYAPSATSEKNAAVWKTSASIRDGRGDVSLVDGPRMQSDYRSGSRAAKASVESKSVSHSQAKRIVMQSVMRSSKVTPTGMTRFLTSNRDIVFLQDTTGSQGPYIKAARQAIRDICDKISASAQFPKELIRFGLIAFRDHPPQDNTYVTKEFGFTSDIAVMQKNLAGLVASGGGDGPEASTAALAAALNLEWKEDAIKIVILITDAPPHGIGESGDGFDKSPDQNDPLEIVRQMAEKGITLFVIACEPSLSQSYRFALDFYSALVQITSGRLFPLLMADKLGDYIVGSAVETIETENLISEFEQVIIDDVYGKAKPIEEVMAEVQQQLQSRGTKLQTIDIENVYEENEQGAKNRKAWFAAPSLAAARSQVEPVSDFALRCIQTPDISNRFTPPA